MTDWPVAAAIVLQAVLLVTYLIIRIARER